MLLVPSLEGIFNFNKMKTSKAKQKYGEKTFQKMQKYLNGITVLVINKKTSEYDIPESDLRRAYELLTIGKTEIPWD